MNSLTQRAASLAAVCPKAPPGAAGPVNDIQGYILWGVGILFLVGVVVGVGGIAGGRLFSMPHASKASVIGIVVIFCAIIGYLILPAIAKAMLGSGCVN